MNNNQMKLVPDSTVVFAMMKAKQIGVKMLASDCEQILRVVLEEPEFMAGLAAAVKDARAMSDRLDEARRIDPKDLNTPIFTHPARSIHQPDLTASLQAENKRFRDTLTEIAKHGKTSSLIDRWSDLQLADYAEKALITDIERKGE
jgi:hypothetical protein